MKKNQNAITKERVLEVYADIREKMIAIGAPVCNYVTLEYMPKSLKVRMGDCTRLNKGVTKFRIRLNPVFLSGFMSEASLYETLAHELVHTFPKCQNHGKWFQSWSARLNAKYGWGIGTYANAQTTREYTTAEIKDVNTQRQKLGLRKHSLFAWIAAVCMCSIATQQALSVGHNLAMSRINACAISTRQAT